MKLPGSAQTSSWFLQILYDADDCFFVFKTKEYQGNFPNKHRSNNKKINIVKKGERPHFDFGRDNFVKAVSAVTLNFSVLETGNGNCNN